MTVTKFYVSLNVSLTEIPGNLWDFANKLIIIQVQYGKKGRNSERSPDLLCNNPSDSVYIIIFYSMKQ